MFERLLRLFQKEERQEHIRSIAYKYMIDEDENFFCVFELDKKVRDGSDPNLSYYHPYVWDFHNRKFSKHNIVEIKKYPENWKVAKDDEILHEYLQSKGVLVEWILTRIRR